MKRTFLRIAQRNIRKNRRRSLVTISAIALGFAALTLFRGYTSNVYEELRWSAVIEEGHGHLTVYKKGWLEHGSIEPKKYLLSAEEVERVIAEAQADPAVVLATPKLDLAGLASNGEVSHIFIAEGVVPEDFARLKRVGGDQSHLDPAVEAGVEMAEGLAKVLKVGPAGTAVLAGATLDGQMNALDVELLHTFNTEIPQTNDKFVRMPFALAQQLYDTDKADRVVVLLDRFDHVEGVGARLQQRLHAAGVATEVKAWDELSVFYNSTNEMLALLLGFMGTIVLVIVIMSVINTMAVAVMERTREIGTLRALGLKRRSARALFAMEGALLGLIGSLAGLTVHSVVWLGVKLARPTYRPPGFSEDVPFVVDFVPDFVAAMTVAMVLFALVSAIVPAARAARQNVVEALGHV